MSGISRPPRGPPLLPLPGCRIYSFSKKIERCVTSISAANWPHNNMVGQGGAPAATATAVRHQAAAAEPEAAAAALSDTPDSDVDEPVAPAAVVSRVHYHYVAQLIADLEKWALDGRVDAPWLAPGQASLHPMASKDRPSSPSCLTSFNNK
jgi:hypothetical protein